MDDMPETIEELRGEIAALRAENERLRTTAIPSGVSRRQLLTGGAGVLGAMAGAGLLAGNRPAFAASAADAGVEVSSAASTAPSPTIFLKLVGAGGKNAAPGSVTMKGFEKSIPVLELHHAIDDDIGSNGVTQGVRVHQPLEIFKPTDVSSPALYNLFHKNTLLQAVQFSYLRPTSQGQMIQFYTVTLNNASIASIHAQYAPRDGLSPLVLDLYEEVSFSYESIQWKWANPALTATDNWDNQR